MGHNSKNMGTTWVHQYNKWVVLITIRGYTDRDTKHETPV